jgi:DNA-binding transcriptional MocR family regulator
MGQNPTGSLLSVERRRELYAVCCEFDVIIVEDDPYWNLQYPSAVAAEAKSRGLPTHTANKPLTPVKSSGYEFLDSLVPSYLSMDNEGRVIRLDSFSKTIAPGCRLGWITAQPAFIERLGRITECSTQQPSGFAQSMVAELLMGKQPEALSAFRALTSSRDKMDFGGWEMDGWVKWLEGLRGAYERRMQRMCTILDDNSHQLKQSTPVQGSDAEWGVITKTKLLSFQWPRAGMFVWVRIHFETHPLWQARGRQLPLLDGPQLGVALTMFCTHKPHLVIPGPGGIFAANDAVRTGDAWAYMRLCFAAVSDDDVDACSLRFAQAVQRFWRVKSVEEMEKYIEEMDLAKGAQQADDDGLVNIGSTMGC